jgi:hypothetical protein
MRYAGSVIEVTSRNPKPSSKNEFPLSHHIHPCCEPIQWVCTRGFFSKNNMKLTTHLYTATNISLLNWMPSHFTNLVNVQNSHWNVNGIILPIPFLDVVSTGNLPFRDTSVSHFHWMWILGNWLIGKDSLTELLLLLLLLPPPPPPRHRHAVVVIIKKYLM